MRFARAVFTLLLVLIPASHAQTEVAPRSSGGDPHLQIVDYDPRQVVLLRVAVGYQLVLELAADERVETVALGDSGGWQASANKRADHVFIKPLQAGAATNLTVITDVRRYAFNLIAAEANAPDLPYTVRFSYPPAEPLIAQDQHTSRAIFKLGGDRHLRPARMFDDGRFTFIDWPADTDLPAIYVLGAKGEETLVNGAMRDGHYVVETIASRFIFRRGAQSATARRQAVPDR